MMIVIMGVCGSGKSTVGMMLAEKLGYSFFDADDFHPQENIDKMASGQPLNDDDRKPWLMRLNEKLKACYAEKNYAILACSALKQSYRDMLADGLDEFCVVYLKGDYDTIYARMTTREDHYMGAQMLTSQFEALEEPTDALEVSVADEPEVIVANIAKQLKAV